jgi:OOP family OmpA-OmpF porin
MKHRVLVATIACLGATSAWAQDSGLYVGVGVGQFNVDSGDDYDADDNVLKVFGGYRFNPYFALEVDFIDLGSPEDRGVKTEVNGFAPYAIGTLPLGPVELFARAGLYFYDVDLEVGTASSRDSSSDLVWGVGAGMTFFDHLHVRLEYEFFEIEDTDDANALWLSGAWRF